MHVPGQLLLLQALFKAALHHTTAVLVGTNLVAVGHTRTVDELGVVGVLLRSWVVFILRGIGRFESQQKGLDHVVSIWMRREIEDALGHFGSDRENLVVKLARLLTQHLNQGLNAARSVQVHRDLDELGYDGFDELLECRDRADFNKLLAQVVAELVHHDLGQHLEHDVDEALREH